MTPLPAALMWMTVAVEGAQVPRTQPTAQAQHSAQTQLEAAEALRVGLRTAPAEARSARRRAAIEAYREVQRRFPRAHAEVAEAAGGGVVCSHLAGQIGVSIPCGELVQRHHDATVASTYATARRPVRGGAGRDA